MSNFDAVACIFVAIPNILETWRGSCQDENKKLHHLPTWRVFQRPWLPRWMGNEKRYSAVHWKLCATKYWSSLHLRLANQHRRIVSCAICCCGSFDFIHKVCLQIGLQEKRWLERISRLRVWRWRWNRQCKKLERLHLLARSPKPADHHPRYTKGRTFRDPVEPSNRFLHSWCFS